MLAKLLAIALGAALGIFSLLSANDAAETIQQLVAAAKSEKEPDLVAGPTTFGGRKGLAEIETAFNKRFGLNAQLRFSAGPEMNAMAARVISEYKAGGKAPSSTKSW